MPIRCVVLLQKAAGFFFEPTREAASTRSPAAVFLLDVAEPRLPPSDLRRVEPALFLRALLASIDTEDDFATEAIGKLTRDGLGKWTATE